MLSIKQIPIILLMLFISIAGMNSTYGFNNNSRDNEPGIIIHDTIAAPGELLLQLDAINFVGDNGNIAAISLSIEIDTLLLEFNGITNMTIPGSWLANYNEIENEITITFTAPYPLGYDIDGKLLDLKLNYFGGFPADLHFKDNCEIANAFLQEIENVEYTDGTINQITAVGNIGMDSVVGIFQQELSMPLTAFGSGYDQVDKMHFRVGYDSLLINYIDFTESALSGVEIVDDGSVLTIDWEDIENPMDFTSPDTLLYLNFTFVGDTNAVTDLLPGSKVYSNDTILATDYFDGFVRGKYIVVTENNPEDGGTSIGGGLYFPGDTVTLTAIPSEGFHFENWTQNGDTLASDSVFVFEKQFGNDTIVANYGGNIHTVILIASPEEGGNLLGAGYYYFGDPVEVTAIAAPGYYFEYWLNGGDTVSFLPVYNFNMPDSNVTLTAVFALYSYIITDTTNNPLFGSTWGGGIFNYGDTCVLTAEPFEGYKFVVWTENGEEVSYNPIYEFEVDGDRDLVGNFAEDIECSSPINLYVDELTETSALLHWTPSGEEEEWDLIWGETGFDTINEGELVSGLTEISYYLDGLNAGTGYDYYVRAICSNEGNSTWSNVFTFTTWYVGISDYLEQNQMKIYPNPTGNILNVSLSKVKESLVKYRIIDGVGKVQFEGKTFSQKNFSIDLTGLSPGIYTIQLILNNKPYTRIFLKQ